jgi:hypothetical protein
VVGAVVPGRSTREPLLVVAVAVLCYRAWPFGARQPDGAGPRSSQSATEAVGDWYPSAATPCGVTFLYLPNSAQYVDLQLWMQYTSRDGGGPAKLPAYEIRNSAGVVVRTLDWEPQTGTAGPARWVSLPLTSDMLNKSVTYTIVLDPRNVIRETDETNNVMTITLDIPITTYSRDVTCTVDHPAS